MHYERIKGIPPAIREAPHLYAQNKWGNPNLPYRTCNSAACVAGWTVALYGREERKLHHITVNGGCNYIETYAAELLELTYCEAQVLFHRAWPAHFFNLNSEQQKIMNKHQKEGRIEPFFTPTPDEAIDILERIGNGELPILELEHA